MYNLPTKKLVDIQSHRWKMYVSIIPHFTTVVMNSYVVFQASFYAGDVLLVCGHILSTIKCSCTFYIRLKWQFFSISKSLLLICN